MVLYVDDEQTLVKPLQLDFRNGWGVRKYLQLKQRIGSHRKDHICSQPTGNSSPLAITCLPSVCLQISIVLVRIP